MDNKYIVILTQVLKDKTERDMYLSDIVNHIQFSEGIADAIPFPTFDQAKSVINKKFISLTNWIAYSEPIVKGVYICEISSGNIIVERTRYI